MNLMMAMRKIFAMMIMMIFNKLSKQSFGAKSNPSRHREPDLGAGKPMQTITIHRLPHHHYQAFKFSQHAHNVPPKSFKIFFEDASWKARKSGIGGKLEAGRTSAQMRWIYIRKANVSLPAANPYANSNLAKSENPPKVTAWNLKEVFIMWNKF